jgi:hypothetical protein
MKVFCLIYFLSAFCLVIVPAPSAGSPPREVPVSMSSSDESGVMAEATTRLPSGTLWRISTLFLSERIIADGDIRGVLKWQR